MNAADFVAITRLRDAKYSTWDWTYGASPPFTERKVQRFPWGKVEVSYDIRQGSVVECHFTAISSWPGRAKSLTDEVSSCEIYDLEEAMRGVPYTNEALSPVLDRFPLHLLFSGCDPDELKAFYCRVDRVGWKYWGREGNFSEEKFPSLPKTPSPFPKTFVFIESLFSAFLGADPL